MQLQKFKEYAFAQGAKVGLSAAAVSAFMLAAATNAHAAIDITAATTGIDEAKTAVLGVLAAMMAFVIAIWGLRKVISLFGR